ncbi:30S ribosomal protein S18 [Patescibacteria group bacterium]
MNSPKVKVCYFCTNNISRELDYKDSRLLTRFLSSYSKILPRRRTGTCLKHQRKLAEAIKRARYMALIPYTNR